MMNSINLSRVILPNPRKDILRRVRLLDRIHQNIDRKLTFISAPAGYGKTSLVLDFAKDVDAVICWYQISSGDELLNQFAHYLLIALRQEFNDFGTGLEDIIHAPGALDPNHLAVLFLNEILAKVDDFCVLCLDDYHIVGESQPIVDFMETLLEHLPDQVRLIIASRSEYGVPTMRLYVRNHINVLGKDDLRFETLEIIELVRLNFHYTMPLERAKQLALRSDGWIVAIHLSLQTKFSDEFWKLGGSPADQLYRFLAEDVVRRERPELRDFMLATSILDEFTEPLASHMLELPTSQLLIQELDKRNLFLTSVETKDGITYRYHQLFLEFLRNQLEKGNPVRKTWLHRRAASWFRQKANMELALAHKLMAGDRLEAAKWMDEVARDFYVSGSMKLIHQWVEALASPPDMRLFAPQLLLNQAKVFINQGDYKAGKELVDLIEPIIRENRDDDQLVNLLITKAMAAKMHNQMEQALDVLDEVQRILLSYDRGSSA